MANAPVPAPRLGPPKTVEKSATDASILPGLIPNHRQRFPNRLTTTVNFSCRSLNSASDQGAASMEVETPEGLEPDHTTDPKQSRHRMLRAVFYFGCSTIILAAIFVALVSAAAPPPDEARIIVTDDGGMQIPSDDTIKALREACAAELIEEPTWHWSPLRWSDVGLRCVFRNRDTNLLTTLVWQFQDSGTDASGNQLALLSGITINGKDEGPYEASYFLVAVLLQMRR